MSIVWLMHVWQRPYLESLDGGRLVFVLGAHNAQRSIVEVELVQRQRVLDGLRVLVPVGQMKVRRNYGNDSSFEVDKMRWQRKLVCTMNAWGWASWFAELQRPPSVLSSQQVQDGFANTSSS